MRPQTLQDAIERDQVDAIHGLLRDQNLSLETRNAQGENAVQYFAHHGKNSIPDAQRRIRVVNYFLHFGWSVDQEVELGRSLLHCAVIHQDLLLIQYLIENTKITLDLKDHTGCTPLYLACQLGYAEIVAYLLEKKADKACVNLEGDTLLHTAAKHGHQAVMGLLLTKGITVNATNKFKETALHQCLGHPSAIQLVEKLVSVGANLNAQDCKGDTPLHRMVSEKEEMQFLVLEKLCNAGAGLNIKNFMGETPLYKACSHYDDLVVSEERTAVLEKMITFLITQPAVEYNHIGPPHRPLTIVMAEDLKWLSEFRKLGVLEYRTPQMSEKKISSENLLSLSSFQNIFPAVIKKVHSLENSIALLEAVQGSQVEYQRAASGFLKGEPIAFEQRKALEILLGLCKQEIDAQQFKYLNATQLLSPHELVLLEDALFSFNVVEIIHVQIREHFRNLRRPWKIESTLRAVGETVGLLTPAYSLVAKVHADPTGPVSGYVRDAFEGVDIRQEPWYGRLAPELQKSMCKMMGVMHPLSSTSPVALVGRRPSEEALRTDVLGHPTYSINCAPQK